jgi:hypothetical protein
MWWHLIPESTTEGIIHYREDSRKECNLAEIVIAELLVVNGADGMVVTFQ